MVKYLNSYTKGLLFIFTLIKSLTLDKKTI